MSHKFLTALMVTLVIAMAAPVMAHRYQRNRDDNPLRIVSYVLHPVGVALEYTITRPIHWLVSRPDADIWFGHAPSMEDNGTYFEWTHGDFSPSIANEYDAQKPAAPAASSEETASE